MTPADGVESTDRARSSTGQSTGLRNRGSVDAATRGKSSKKPRKPAAIAGLDPRYKPELIFGHKNTPPSLSLPFVDVEGKQAVATDGRMLAVFPLTGKPKPVKRPKKMLPFPPDWRKALPDFKSGDRGTITVGLDVRLLERLARAIDCEGTPHYLRVYLTIEYTGRGPYLDQILVRPVAGDKPSATGVLMPVMPVKP